MCLYPKLVKNPKYFKNGKPRPNYAFVTDHRVDWVPIGCGKCIECRKQKANEWRVRLQEELKNSPDATFVTLTFRDEVLDEFEEIEANEVCARAVELFRKRYQKQYGKALRRWLIVELGHPKKSGEHLNTERVHMHGLIWFKGTKEEFEQVWQYGYVHFGEYVNLETINYIVKYVTKTDADHPQFLGRIFASPGIGKGYNKTFAAEKNRYRGKNTDETYRLSNGSRVALPVYYRNSVYTDKQKEQLWLHKLDKMERFVRGEKIDISTPEGQNEYYNALRYRQKENEMLGYPKNPWNVQKYAKSRMYLDKLK